MEFINYTPFPHRIFPSDTPADQPMAVIVLRGTFRIVAGAPLRPVPEQAPVALWDVFRGERRASSVLATADAAPFKPRTDIHLIAIAHAPGGKPAAAWPVRIRVGSCKKDLLGRGPHELVYARLFGWTKTKPRPCREVALSYENAFGGSFVIGGEPAAVEENPAGTGWIPRTAPKDEPIRSPQVLALDEPEHVPGRRYLPQGCGPMSPRWAAQWRCNGTLEKPSEEIGYRRTHQPGDEMFYNSAHPDLVYNGHLKRVEEIGFVSLSAQAPVIRTSVRVDVAAADPDAHRVSLVWRGRPPWPERVRRLELRMRELERAGWSKVTYG
ncbi:uncharacterized protein SOCE26_009060 [Sorangium cellulosum]|uniref:DUF2169 domain-containing protein n=1 Tax=Sorangium cellulosum TaxID=56 RepID=A0A2L0EJN2_SORCE|nr:DUF2169 domain-containing protein [Sorangium cellulosum]AUX39513.1 uncharacterized protein SOCE26_009060 [Sorangium cellulosum]